MLSFAVTPGTRVHVSHHLRLQHRLAIYGDQSSKAKALLLLADGSEIKLVSYSVKERGDEDGNEDRRADFYDRIPDLRPWLGDAFQQRAMATFYVDALKKNIHTYRASCNPGLSQGIPGGWHLRAPTSGQVRV